MDTIALYTAAAVLLLLSLLKDRNKTALALKKAAKALEGIMPQFVVVLVLVSLTLAVVNNEMISKILGGSSGILGVLGASLVGAITLVPGFVAFPVAAALLNDGAGVIQVAAFVSSLMMVGIITLPMEIKYFGKKAAIWRNSLAFFFSLAAAVFVGWVVGS